VTIGLGNNLGGESWTGVAERLKAKRAVRKPGQGRGLPGIGNGGAVSVVYEKNRRKRSDAQRDVEGHYLEG